MPETVRFNEFAREPAALRAAQLDAVCKVMDSGWYVLGQNVCNFEAEWSIRCQSTGCVGVASGLDALEIGLRVLGIGLGDEVITTPLTAYATVLAIQRVGATPVFADIDPSTACICPDSVRHCISAQTKAVIVVHLYGRAADMAALSEICTSQGIELVEDCAQAHLSQYAGQPVGTFGRYAAWSFYPTKNLGAIGDAGAITSNDSDFLSSAQQFRNYGQSDRYHHVVAGQNSRLDELHAAILSVRLSYLESWTNSRRNIAARYWDGINNPKIRLLLRPADPTQHVNHLFVVCVAYREHFMQHLAKHHIQSLIHYPVPAHKQEAIGFHKISPQGLQFSLSHSQTCVSLPIHPHMTGSEIQRVITACNSW